MKFLVTILPCIVSNMAYAEMFYPKSATINDAQGTFTSQSFDSPAMNEQDAGTHISINWGGNNAILYQLRENKYTYETSQSYQGQQITITAYRSTQSYKIYLVSVTQRFNGSSIIINFKP